MPPSPPTPAQVEVIAKDYLDLKDKFLQAKLAATEIEQELSAKGEVLRQLASDFGSGTAEKSKLLHGLAYEVMVTFGQSVSIDAAAVENFRLALVKTDQPRLLKKLFEKTIRWSLNPRASELVRGEKLSDRLRSLFARCEVVKAKTPSLSVREKTDSRVSSKN